MGDVKRRCRAMRASAGGEVFECERKRGHRKKHKASWREGMGGRYLDIVAKWPRSS